MAVTMFRASDRKGSLDLVRRMMAIPGRSGEESRIVEFVLDQLRRAKVPRSDVIRDNVHERSPIGGEVGNLIVRLKGTTAGPRRLLMAHLDTVPLCVGSKPVVRKGRIVSADAKTGVGADDRSGAAVILSAALEVVRRGLPHPPLTFLWTVQEEVGLIGARHVSLTALGRPKLAFNFDGGAANKVTVGTTGAYRIDIDVIGIPSHAGVRPEQGVSATTIVALAVAQLHHDGWLGRIEKDGKKGTSNVGVVHAGEATNVVSAHAKVRAEVRSHDPDFRLTILEAFRTAFTQSALGVRNVSGECGRIVFTSRLDYESFRLADNEPCVVAAEAAVRAAGGEPYRAISDGGLDANWLTAHGVPTVTLGAGQENAHTTREYLDVEEFLRACQVARCLAGACESSGPPARQRMR
jgi:tripeptide aminopeptidase